MPGGKRDDQVAMNYRLRARRQDQAAIRRLRDAIDGALDLACIREQPGSNPVFRVFPLHVRSGAASGIAGGTGKK
jgi:hypothetical protein